MKEIPAEGSIAEIPFPRLLFEIWTRERSGRLGLRKEAEERTLVFDKGRLLVARESFDEAEFLGALVRKKVLSSDQARQSERLAALENASLIKAVGELGLLSPIPLWNLLESFFVRQLFPLFDWDEGAYAFDSPDGLSASPRFGLLEVHDFILQGIRQMRNDRILERALPGLDEAIQVSAPYFLHLLKLEPYERYALNVLSESADLRTFLDRSELGTRENRKVLYAFACLGVLSGPALDGRPRPAGESPGFEHARILAALDEKCAYVFKYVSKEAGPIAQTILSKSLEEIKSFLGPMFRKIEILDDGRVEVDPALRQGVNVLSEEVFRQLVRGYDEILMAEILAVKKSLGPAHETAVVRNLEKIGCL
jgi:hypothetical protein